MVRSDTTVVEGWLEDSCWHGPVRVTEMRRFRGFRQQVGWAGGCGKWINNTVALQVTWVGVYCRGVAAGPCWQWSEGGGWLTGSVDREGAFTGDNIAFLYPDLRCRTSPLNSIHLASVHLYTWPLYT